MLTNNSLAIRLCCLKNIVCKAVIDGKKFICAVPPIKHEESTELAHWDEKTLSNKSKVGGSSLELTPSWLLNNLP